MALSRSRDVRLAGVMRHSPGLLPVKVSINSACDRDEPAGKPVRGQHQFYGFGGIVRGPPCLKICC